MRSSRRDESGFFDGSITVTLTLVFVILLALVLAVIENTRILTAGGYVSVAADAAMETVFGSYNKELFDEYHLLGYGGYSGKDLSDLEGEIKRVAGINLQAHPKDVKRGYSDLYRIENISCQAVDAESIATHEQFMKQVSYYLGVAAVEDVSEKILKKFKDNANGDAAMDVSDKLSKTEEYENGKYDSYFADGDGQVSEENIKQGKKEIDTALAEDEAKGNPLSVMKEMVTEGVLSLVCDTSKLSDVAMQKREPSEDGDGRYDSMHMDSGQDGINVSDMEVSDYLENITGDGEVGGFMSISEVAADKGKAIAYALKLFSCYAKPSSQAVKYGLEYLVSGHESEKENLLDIVSGILAIRMVSNFLYVSRNALLLEQSLATATILVGFTGIEPLITALQYTILLILAFEESCVDVSALLIGKSVPFVKDNTSFQMKYGEICMGCGDFFRNKAKNYKCMSENKAVMKYTQFLLLFMLPVPTEKLESRIFDIIEFDLQERYNQTFCLGTCFSKTGLDVTYQVPAMFGNIGKYGNGERKYGKIERKLKLSYAYTK